jgi:four helix bundle protein
MRDFRDLKIWKASMTLAVDVYKTTSILPREEEYGLKSQIRRASISIPSNISEGCSRKSQREFGHFLQISLGSAFEIETDLLLARNLNLISSDQLNFLLPRLHELQKQINSLITKIRSEQS